MRRISYSAIRRYENCIASYLYYLIVPRIEFTTGKDVSLFGRKFHEWAEKNFKPSELDAVIDEENVDVKDMEDFALAVKDKEYFQHPAVNEFEISYDIEPLATIWGFPDRIAVDLEKGNIIIPDYKTAFYADPITDIKQLQIYGYILYSNKELRMTLIEKFSEQYPEQRDRFTEILTDLKADQICLILDYVKADYVYPFWFDDQKIKRFERYLFGVLRRILNTEIEFAKHKNMKKITHSDGNCNFCNMAGMCLPYHILVNSYYDTEFEKEITQSWQDILSIPQTDGIITQQYDGHDAGTPVRIIQDAFCAENGIELEYMLDGEIRLSTMGMIAEYQDRTRIDQINTHRLKALKRTLMMRLEGGDTTVSTYFRKQKNQMVSYPTSEVLKTVVPKIVKGSLKDVRFKDMLDFNKIESELTKILEHMLNSGVKKSNIPEQFHNDMEKHKVVSYTNAFLMPLK